MVVLMASLTACGGGGTGTDDPTPDAAVSMACMEATGYQDLTNIEEKIFKSSCIFSGCHNGAATDAGRIDLREGMSHPKLVNVMSQIDTNYKMVSPGQPNQSFLLMIMGHIAPADMMPPATRVPDPPGLMPQGTGGIILCAEKRDAIKRWITAGAMNN